MKKKDGTYKKKDGLRYALCKGCKKEYNISVFQEVKKQGYVCPKCRRKKETDG